MPVDLLAVNAGISPQLTGGQPSPPAEEEPKLNDELSRGLGGALPATLARSERSSRSSNNSNDGDGSAGPSRESSRVRAPAPKARKAAAAAPYSTTASSSTTINPPAIAPAVPAPSTTFNPSVASVGATTNLVTKDAVIASHILTSMTLPPRAGSQPMELLVLGVPTIGAKSRVETQIKITLALVSTKPGVASTRNQPVGDGQGVPGGRFITPDGGLEYRADQEYQRVGGWTHLRLPRLLAIKKKGKKAVVEGESCFQSIVLQLDEAAFRMVLRTIADPRFPPSPFPQLQSHHHKTLSTSPSRSFARPPLILTPRKTRSSSVKAARLASTSARRGRRTVAALLERLLLQRRRTRRRRGGRSSSSTAPSLSTLMEERRSCRRGLPATAGITKRRRASSEFRQVSRSVHRANHCSR